MSERPPESSVPASSSHDGANLAAHAPGTLPATSRQPAPLDRPSQSRGLPPPPRPSRSASFSNILNPDDGTERRRKVPELGSPAVSASALPSLRHSGQSPAVPGSSGAHIEHRRILTPKSPTLHRAVSMGQLTNPMGSIDAQRSPFLGSHTYIAEPGAAGVPPMPTPRARAPHSPTSLSTQDIKTRSPSMSPRTSYAPQYGSSRSSPHVTTLPSLSAVPYGAEYSERRRPLSIPITSAASQNVYQMMTLQTSAGAVQVPVDVQAASRVADEKRRRNAGASARFRARRKEKEKESSSTISKLEMQVKDLAEDADFYRQERNYLAGVLQQVPGGERHFPRPQSPRHRRVSMHRSTSGSGDYMSGHEMSQSPGGDRHVRRRTSTLSMPVPAGPSYAPQHYDPQQYHSQQPLPGPASLLPPLHSQLGAAPFWQPYSSEQQGRPSDRHAR